MNEEHYKNLIAENNVLKAKLKNTENENDTLLLRLESIENNLRSLKVIPTEKESHFAESNLNRLLEENTFKSRAEAWSQAMDELAHAIQTSITVAINGLLELPESPERIASIANIRQVKNFTDLVLWDIHLRKGELLDTTKLPIKIDLLKIVSEVIDSIKSEPSVLRPKNEIRRNQYKNMTILLKFPPLCKVYIPSELKYVFNLLFFELLKNAFKNTESEKPLVSVSIETTEEFHYISFLNNKIMPKLFGEWLEGISEDSSFNMPTGDRLGLNLIKRWNNILKITTTVRIFETKKETIITLKIPKIIKL